MNLADLKSELGRRSMTEFVETNDLDVTVKVLIPGQPTREHEIREMTLVSWNFIGDPRDYFIAPGEAGDPAECDLCNEPVELYPGFETIMINHLNECHAEQLTQDIEPTLYLIASTPGEYMTNLKAKQELHERINR